MKYRDLIEFEPIETVIQLRSADQPSEAETLVRTYVISESMGGDLVETVFPNLQYNEDYDHRGMLIVGNYGTGKSHLMALITSIAENENLVKHITNDRVRENSDQIAGKFKVIRAEIGAVQMSLRDIVINELEEGISKMGIKYTFPKANTITNNKDPLTEMMIEFGEKYPEKGLIFALDELLDYLGARKQQELRQDLIFLRELGEICKETRFRFIAGVQEAVFDSPTFQFAADSLRRVKDRFQEVFIKREDIEFVISQRLLKKNDRQRDHIRKHLENYASYYLGISERIENYVDLFPVHPYFIEIFEQLRFAEKRIILKTLSQAITHIIDNEVPSDSPGVLTYDIYWENIKVDPSFRTIPAVTTVKEKSLVLENKMVGFPRPNNKPIAVKLIHALSIYRLITDIKSPIGTTAEELRDQLFIPFPAGTPDQMKNEDDLKGIITTILSQIMQTVSGQYLSFNKENGQYYIDIDKDVDYDQLIKDKADSLDNETFDTYYFDALTHLMECSTTTYVSGFKIWEHELVWTQKNTTRLGYLFFGEPNSRSTAQPPRDFYVYFQPFFDKKPTDHDNQTDEVFLTLVNPDTELVNNIQLYSGARELEKRSTVGSKEIFRVKAEGYRRSITQNLYGKSTTIYDVVYQASNEKIVKYLHQSTAQLTFREIIDHVTSVCLSSHFQDQAPEYPTFTSTITQSNREQVVKDALRALAAETKTKLGTTILDGLELLDGDIIRSNQSRYARYVLDKINQKGDGVVLNYEELISRSFGVPYDIRYRLEPELLVVVLAALVREGQIELNISGTKFTAANLDELIRTPISELISFKHLQKPKDFPIDTLRRIFEILDLTPGLVSNSDYLDDAVVELQKRLGELLPKIVETDQKITNGLTILNSNLLSADELKITREQIEKIKSFLESLQRYNTTGRLRNCRIENHELDQAENDFKEFNTLLKILDLVSAVTPLSQYLSGAQSVLSSDDPWSQNYNGIKTHYAPLLLRKLTLLEPKLKSDLLADLKRFKQEYIQHYFEIHQKTRLDASSDSLKGKLVKSPKMERLNRLATLDLLPNNTLTEFGSRLASLKTCFSLTQNDLQSTSICPHCQYRPVEELFKGNVQYLLSQYESELDTINNEWDQTILKNLQDPMVQQALDALVPAEKKIMNGILSSGTIPEIITSELLTILQQIFAGLEKIEVTFTGLIGDLSKGGMPCTIEDYQKRFETHLQQLTSGKDKSKLRIILEK